MSDRLRVAAVQMELRAEPTVDDFRDHVSEVVGKAVDAGAELIVLPEMCTTGLLATHRRATELTREDMPTAYRETFPALTDTVVEIFSSTARRHDVWLCGGSHWRQTGDQTYRNTSFFCHPDGRVDAQDKLHLTWPEEEIGTQRGDWIEPIDVGGVRIAIQICADIEFPEVTRAMALKGVDVILCPSLTWNSRGRHRVRHSALARSVEHQVFVVMAPMVGSDGIPSDGAMHAKGHALITTPIDRAFGVNDGVLAESVNGDREGLVVADLDIAQLSRSRASSDTPGLRHGRPDLYERLMRDALKSRVTAVDAVASPEELETQVH